MASQTCYKGEKCTLYTNKFTKSGYKIAWYNFFSDDYLSIDEIMERANGSMSLYIVNSRTIRKYHQK